MVELVATAVPGDVGLLRISSMPCVRHLTSSMGHDVKVDTRPVRPPASALCSSVIDSLDRTRISDLTTSFTHTHTETANNTNDGVHAYILARFNRNRCMWHLA